MLSSGIRLIQIYPMLYKVIPLLNMPTFARCLFCIHRNARRLRRVRQPPCCMKWGTQNQDKTPQMQYGAFMVLRKHGVGFMCVGSCHVPHHRRMV